MIQEVTVEGLRGLAQPRIAFALQPGVNVLTGKNGSGKTTLLKLIWYLTSGNIEQAFSETPFQYASITTDRYRLEIDNRPTSERHYRVTIDEEEHRFTMHFDEDGDPEWFGSDDDPDDLTNALVSSRGSSVFLPTFRRIEGGFGINRRTARSPLLRASAKQASNVESAMEDVSRRLSNSQHTLVCSVSTTDIASILLQKYSELSEQANQNQTATYQKIIDKIKLTQAVGDTNFEAKEVLEQVLQTIEMADERRASIFVPIEGVRSVVADIFKSKSIMFGNRLSFGDAATAIASDALSAGEKQMLSFICYNALNEKSSIFIDEPELSLHVDWQRMLFSTLGEQATSNQFIVATHSPFIYSKFPDAEVRIHEDTGDTSDL